MIATVRYPLVPGLTAEAFIGKPVTAGTQGPVVGRVASATLEPGGLTVLLELHMPTSLEVVQDEPARISLTGAPGLPA